MADGSVNEKISSYIEADILSSSSATDNNSTFDVEDIIDHRVGSGGKVSFTQNHYCFGLQLERN